MAITNPLPQCEFVRAAVALSPCTASESVDKLDIEVDYRDHGRESRQRAPAVHWQHEAA